ncbi:HCN2, partial [Symbiodinium necroappetens]
FLYLLDLHLERHIYFSDETVVVENTEGEDMYILYSGAMEVKVKGITVGKLEGGMFFGEMAVLGLVKKRSATIIAKTLCDVRLLSRRSLEEALSEFPE